MRARACSSVRQRRPSARQMPATATGQSFAEPTAIALSISSACVSCSPVPARSACAAHRAGALPPPVIIVSSVNFAALRARLHRQQHGHDSSPMQAAAAHRRYRRKAPARLSHTALQISRRARLIFQQPPPAPSIPLSKSGTDHSHIHSNSFLV